MQTDKFVWRDLKQYKNLKKRIHVAELLLGIQIRYHTTFITKENNLNEMNQNIIDTYEMELKTKYYVGKALKEKEKLKL